MAKAVLVSQKDIEILGLVLDALNQAQIPVTFCDWNYVEQLGEAQLIIATPWYDTKGPRATYSALIDALQSAGSYEKVPMRRVYLKSPEDPLVELLEAEEPDEGFLHVLRHRDGSYSVLFAPLSGPGGPVPARHFSDESETKEFLLDRLHLSQVAAQEAFSEVAQHGNGAVVTRLTASQLHRSGLAQPRKQPRAHVSR